MVLFYLTNSLLDISAGVLWWIGTKTASAVYQGVSYAFYRSEDENQNKNEEITDNYDSLTKEDIKELVELKKEIKVLKKLLVQKRDI
jgi:hypothetical protein